MTGVTRMLVLVGLLALGVALFMVGRGEPPTGTMPAGTMGDARIGRSALSHGGPGPGTPPAAPGIAPSADRQMSLNPSPNATTR